MQNPIDLNPGFTFNSNGTYTGEGTARPWIPIGRSEKGKEFNGVFDGAGFTIRGIYVNAPNAECAGLFGGTETNSVLKNITIENSYLCGGFIVGGICGGLKGQIKNCTNKNCTIQGNRIVGGICGVLGWENAVIENCKNSGSVSGAGDVGGICGNVNSSKKALKSCCNFGNINSTEGYVGGIYGNSSEDTTVSYCYNEGNVTGSTECVGGIGGQNQSMVSFCYNTGSVAGNGTNSICVGGICGSSKDSKLSNCIYLTGCAKDGNGTYQNGIGNRTSGQSTEDLSNVTTGMTSDQFASGEVAWLLNQITDEQNNTVTGTIFAQGATSPIFADEEHKSVVRIRLTGANEITFYPALGSSLPELPKLNLSTDYVAGTIVTGDTDYTLDASILSATPSLTDSIAFCYTVTLKNSLLNGQVPVMRFTFREKSYEVIGEIANSGEVYSTYTFPFSGIFPQFMSENLSAELIINGTKVVEKSTYSFREYALSMLQKTKEYLKYNDEKYGAFRTLLVDLLYYGEDSQRYLAAEAGTGTQLSESTLATFGLTDTEKLLRSADKSTEAANSLDCVSPAEGDYTEYAFCSATLVLTDRINLSFTFTAPSIANLKVKVSRFNGTDYTEVTTISDFTETEDDNTYRFTYTGIPASELGQNLKLEIYISDSNIGSYVIYGVNSYINYALTANISAALNALLRSIYGYELSVINFMKY